MATNCVGGAFEPAPAGQDLLYTGYGAEGFEIRCDRELEDSAVPVDRRAGRRTPRRAADIDSGSHGWVGGGHGRGARRRGRRRPRGDAREEVRRRDDLVGGDTAGSPRACQRNRCGDPRRDVPGRADLGPPRRHRVVSLTTDHHSHAPSPRPLPTPLPSRFALHSCWPVPTEVQRKPKWGGVRTIGGMDVRMTAGRIRSGEVSAREVVQELLDLIAATQDALNVFVHIDAEGALAAADDVDRARHAGEPLGPLAGVPFGVKDLEDCAGMPTTRGSRWYADGSASRPGRHPRRPLPRPPERSPFGKTAAPEFGAFGYTASPLHGVTRNPGKTLERTPVDRVVGTAASVDSRGDPVRDGQRRRRIDPWACGLALGLPGLKPTYGRIPTFGVTRHAQNAVNFAFCDHGRRHRVALRPGCGPRHARPDLLGLRGRASPRHSDRGPRRQQDYAPHGPPTSDSSRWTPRLMTIPALR